jgi:hypothetical protein
MRNTIGKLCVIFATLILLFSAAFFTVSLILKDSDYFEQKYKELNVSEQTGIGTPDLSRATNVLLEYMRGERASIRVEARKNGEDVPDLFFREKEIVHMAEVQNLWLGLGSFAKVGSVVAAVLLLVGILLMQRGARRELISSGMFWGTGVFGGVLAFMGIWAILDFDSFWTVFHFIIFPKSLIQYLSAGATVEAMNELNWVLPAESDMIRILLPIFPPLVFRCAICVILEIVFVALAAVFVRFAWRKQGKPSPIADIVVIEHDANEPMPVEGPDLVLSHKLLNAPKSRREEILRRAKSGEPEEEIPSTPVKEHLLDPIYPKEEPTASAEGEAQEAGDAAGSEQSVSDVPTDVPEAAIEPEPGPEADA